MPSDVEIANLALDTIGARATISSFTEGSNEANVIQRWYVRLRNELLRKAPWNFALQTVNLALNKASPGTPENPTAGTTTWTPAIPPPPWAYSYFYPNNCLRFLYIVPQFQTGFASGVPITTAVTGGSPTFWNGPPARFQEAVDQDTFGNDFKVLLCNQQQAIGRFVKTVTDPNVFDEEFTTALAGIIGERICLSVNGDKGMKQLSLSQCNQLIMEARTRDANEGLTINDHTPDFLRVRGLSFNDQWPQGYSVDWGPLFLGSAV